MNGAEKEKKKGEKRDHRELSIYILIIIGFIFIMSAILYVIHNEEPGETPSPTSAFPTSSPTISAPPSPMPTTPSSTSPVPTTPSSTSPVPTTPSSPSPENGEKIEWEKNSIEAETEEYTSDGRIGVKIMKVYKPMETKSVAIDILFENETDQTQMFNIKNICLFFYKSEGEYIRDRVHWMQLVMTSFELEDSESTFRSSRELSEHIQEIPPKNGLRIIFHFNILAWQPDYVSFENYYYEDLEYTEWKIKVR